MYLDTSNMYLILIVFGVISAVIADLEDDVPNDIRFCLRKHKALYNGSCHILGVKGPCSVGKLLYDDEKANSTDLREKYTAICKETPCPFLQYYWPETGECVSKRDMKKVCGEGKGLDLIDNEYGHGECVCSSSPLHVKVKDYNDGNCYILFKQGPCPDNSVVGYQINGTMAECIPDVCAEQNKHTTDDRIVYAPWTDGKCYEVGSQGPCEGDKFKFQIDKESYSPQCENRNALLSLLESTLTVESGKFGINPTDKNRNTQIDCDNCLRRIRMKAERAATSRPIKKTSFRGKDF